MRQLPWTDCDIPSIVALFPASPPLPLFSFFPFEPSIMTMTSDEATSSQQTNWLLIKILYPSPEDPILGSRAPYIRT